MSTRALGLLAFLFAASLASGCNLNLDSPTLVKTPRILAIVADPPEALPGEDVAISVIAFDPMGRELTYTFEVCFDVGAILDPDAFDPDDALCFPLESDGLHATMPGERTAAITMALDGLTPAQTGGFPVETLRTILGSAGFPLRVRVEVSAPDGTVLVSGHKLVGITTRAERTHNPPAAALFVDGTPYIGATDPDHPFDCMSPSPEPVLADTEIPLQPARDAPTWLETFPIYDFTGGIRTGHEGAYYSWYATGGTMPIETTQYPSEGVNWHAPTEPGTYRLWYVVRDGHLGAAACTFEVEVVTE